MYLANKDVKLKEKCRPILKLVVGLDNGQAGWFEGGGNWGNLDVVGQERIQEKIGRSLFCAGSEQ